MGVEESGRGISNSNPPLRVREDRFHYALPFLILLQPFEIRKSNQTELFCPVRLPIQSPGCRSHRLAKPHMTGIGVKSWMPRHQEMKRMQLVWCVHKA